MEHSTSQAGRGRESGGDNPSYYIGSVTERAISVIGDTPEVIYLFQLATRLVVLDAGRMTYDRLDLADLHALPAAVAVDAVLACCSSPVLARALVAGRPYADIDAVLTAADTVLAELSEDEIDRALAGHPRIGARPDSAASTREQAGVADSGDTVRRALAQGNLAYEQKFGHIYLVCATGKSGAELLELLNARLGNDPDTERRVMRAELAKINRIRLCALLGAGR